MLANHVTAACEKLMGKEIKNKLFLNFFHPCDSRLLEVKWKKRKRFHADTNDGTSILYFLILLYSRGR